MSFFDQILGGGQQQQEYQDFVQRYDQGAPWDGISDQEALERYDQIAPQMSQEQYVDAAQQAFTQMSPDERMQFGQFVQEQATQQGVSLPGLGGGMGGFQDPGLLAQMAGMLFQQQPNLLSQILGGSMGRMMGGGMMGGGPMGGMMGGGPMGGMMGSPLGGMMRGNAMGGGGMLNSPIGRAALAAFAAMAFKQMTGRR
ncbi:MAG: hypothetical protein AVDCRST_MAG88-3980 [uncultured Thermomicrobiales bacterium]|uniref:Uncharacterized protein n=1 Tax=uncultured Thermomicrobiales bacterium TaxID=1645740 RepID=A0A6J4VVK7_9BACT|nr:MAG: hypothetical protein AVDCRST_MAG88-3980 [uncultured Thermomicrobiales bacterium]